MKKVSILDGRIGAVEKSQALPTPRSHLAPGRIGVISTGSLRLDIALGFGGVPRGHIIEITGPDCSGKTTLCQHILAEAQKMGGACAYIDADHALDMRFATRCGVNPERLYICDPVCEEQALETAEILARSGAVEVIAIDSVSALGSRSEMLGRSVDPVEGLEDHLLSLSLRRLSTTIQKTQAVILLTTRAQERPAVVFHNLAGNPGSLALKLYASIRLRLQPLNLIIKNGAITGVRIKIEALKNKLAPLFQPIELDIMYNEGISKNGDILDLGEQLTVITRQGTGYWYRGLLLGEGREKAIQTLRQHSSMSIEIEQIIRQQFLPPALMPVEH